MTSVKRALLLIGVAAAVAGTLFLWRSLDGPRPGLIPTAARPNVVLITIDTLRADRVGTGLTPAIDGLAARGRSYSGLRATAPLTLPSHVSLMTGTIPPVHGVRENGVVFDRRLPTLAKVFKDAGYRTGAFVGAYVLNRRFGLNEGFDEYDDAVRRDAARAELLEAERPGAEVVDAALAWLERQPDPAPFFLWIHMYDPHAPYAPPAEYAGGGAHAYDGEVAYADAQVARVVAALDKRREIDSTVIAVTGDHGESLGEHGEQTHGMLVYEPAVRVPLVVAGAADVPSEISCHQSIASTLLRAAGLTGRIPREMPNAADCPSYTETRYPRRAGWHALTSLSDNRWKLILSSERELYDLQADPGETRNLSAANPSIVEAMTAGLARMQPQQERTATVAPEAAERLRALGYASGSAVITSDDPAAPNPAGVISAWTAFETAFGLLQAKRPAEAARALKRLVGEHPGAPVFQSTYAQALRESGDARAAVAVYRAAVARWPGDPALFHDLAAAARDAGDLNEALRAEQAALALDSNNPMAQNGLGLLHADAGRSADAIAAFTRATEGDPTNPSYWTNLGNAQRDAGNAGAAEAGYRRALEHQAEYADALNGLGVLAVQSGRAGDAIPLLERALRADPELHEARLNLGIAYQESGEREKAAATYREVLKKTPPRYARERNAAAELLRSVGAVRERP
jgi:choline-sulfatase